ncbi:exosporium protein G [Bacillus thuringiensis]|nr:exosporium protein G [Bacillus thuringiensis]MDZ3952335.1 exosporium protein G [Bacillus thuringiensis]RGP43744.1 exosporium protein G [Bacillus thuringiensis]
MISVCVLHEGDFYYLVTKIGDIISTKVPITPEFAATLLLLGTPFCS